MIERFNFYDIYGYLIPGAAWLALLGAPVFLTVPGLELSIAGLTGLGLGGGYLAGHYLSGLSRAWIPSYDLVSGEKQYLSERILDDNDKTLAPAVKAEIQKHLFERFHLRLADHRVRKETFYLFRTALAQGKVGSYVEQYQGIATMTRGLAVASLLTIVYYIFWVAGSVLPLPRWSDASSLAILLTMLLAAIAPWFAVRQLAGNATPENEWKAHPWRHRLRVNADGVVFCAVLAVAGLAGGELNELTRRQIDEAMLAVSVLSLAYYRFKAASKYFSDTMVAAVCRDFLVLATAKAPRS